MPFVDQTLIDVAVEGMADTDAHLFGRKTYEIMAAHWPTAPADDPFARHLNAVPKYVASRTLDHLDWQNSTLFEGDVPEAVAALKEQPGKGIGVLGSGELVRTLMEDDLVDEIQLIIAPIVLGEGKRLFRGSERMRKFELIDAKPTSTGSVMLSYRSA